MWLAWLPTVLSRSPAGLSLRNQWYIPLYLLIGQARKHLSNQYIIVNLGMSTNFGVVDLEHLSFPAHMRVDYIRVYQPSHSRNIGCDPKDFPTAKYINTCVS